MITVEEIEAEISEARKQWNNFRRSSDMDSLRYLKGYRIGIMNMPEAYASPGYDRYYWMGVKDGKEDAADRLQEERTKK